MNITINKGKSVFAAIERIAATSSKIEKEALFKEAGSQSSLFMKVVTYAYDPFKNYGISHAPSKTPGIAATANDLSEDMVWKLLDNLISRDLSGNSARENVQTIVDFLDDESSEVFRRIINKDMRAGFGEGTINRCFKGTLKEFPYMRCTLEPKSNMAKWDWTVGIISQEKADGMFANINFDGSGFLWITSRQGTQFPENCLGVEADLRKTLLHGTQTHAELLVTQDGILLPREEGNGVLNSLQSGGKLESSQKVVIHAWDQIPLEVVVPKGSHDVPYKKRLVSICRQIAAAQAQGMNQVTVVPTKIVHSRGEAFAHYRELLKRGKEGTVLKHPAMPWMDTDGGNKDQVKLKLEVTVELRIKQMQPASPGTKHAATFGSLLCESECGGLSVGVSGMKDQDRINIANNWEKFKDSILSVKANSIMDPEDDEEKHSLFLPRWVEPRSDKTRADTLIQIKDQFAAAVNAA
jgi:DNA ligase-1